MESKRLKVVMLATQEDIVTIPPFLTIRVDKYGDSNDTLKYKFEEEDGRDVPQHLYFLSDEEIKEGDNVLDLELKIVIPITSDLLRSKHTIKGSKKIITTTDKSLVIILENTPSKYKRTITKLPHPSKAFIEKYVSEYNAGRVIEEVEVDSTHNTITTRAIKDSWNRQEVITLFNRCNKELRLLRKEDVEEWIKENL